MTPKRFKTRTVSRERSAYEDREVTETEGRDAEKLARRFLEWAQSRLV